MKTKKCFLRNADNMEALKRLRPNSVDSVVTDPPYGMSDHPDTEKMLEAWLRGDDYSHKSKGGFMNSEWDSFVPQPKLWKECFRVLKPGGHCLAFFSTRTYDLGVLAMRLAGFEIRDSISWLYSQGFPKSLNIGKAIDAKLRTGRSDSVGLKQSNDSKNGKGRTRKSTNKNGILGNKDSGRVIQDELLTAAAQKWNGFGTAMKPSCEIIVVARKPIECKTVADNVLKYGTGGLNIDACRIKYTDSNPPIPQLAQGKTKVSSKRSMYDGQSLSKSNTEATIGGSLEGRWPSNVILSHHPECEYVGIKKVKSHSKPHALNSKKESYDGWGSSISKRTGEVVGYSDKDGNETIEHYVCHPDCPINILDAQTGTLKSGSNAVRRKEGAWGSGNKKNKGLGKSGDVQVSYGDAGGASRFFYCAKVSRAERNAGLDHLPDKNIENSGNVIGLKANVNTSTGKQRNPNTITKNTHPTVKPQKLMEYLCRLINPPNGIVLDPFMGSGSTGVAALNEGFRFIGIEREEEYYKIAEGRIKHAHNKKKPKKLFS